MARDHKLIRGRTTEEKISSIDKLLVSLSKRAGRYVIGALPPIPVFDYLAEPEKKTGIIMRRMFPGTGVILSGTLFVEKYVVEGAVKIGIKIATDAHEQVVFINTGRQRLLSIRPELAVDAGTRLTVFVDPPESIEGIWISLMYGIGFQDTVKSTYVLEELLKLQDGQEAEIVEEVGEPQ